MSILAESDLSFLVAIVDFFTWLTIRATLFMDEVSLADADHPSHRVEECEQSSSFDLVSSP